MINNFLNEQAEILGKLDVDVLFALKDIISGYTEEIGKDYLEDENELKADAIVTKAIKNRMYEMIKAEKSLKNLCEEDEEEFEYFEEAKEIQKRYSKIFNGRSITPEQMECSKRVAEQIRESKSFETSIDIINTTEDLMADNKFGLSIGEDLLFKNYLAICNVINEIIEKDWIDIEDFEIAKDEDLEVREYLLNYIKANRENNLELDIRDVDFLTQFGLEDNIYVRELFDDKDNYYIILVDYNENRLTDCYCPY